MKHTSKEIRVSIESTQTFKRRCCEVAQAVFVTKTFFTSQLKAKDIN